MAQSKPRPKTKPRKKKVDLAEIAEASGVSTRLIYRVFEEYPKAKTFTAEELIRFIKLSPDKRRLVIDADPDVVDVAEEKKKEQSGYKLSLPQDFGNSSGLRVEVDKLRVAARATRSEWSRLVCIGHPDAAKAFNQWTEVLNQWTRIAKDAPKALQELGDSVSKAEHQKSLSATLQAVDRILRGLPDKIAISGEKLTRDKLRQVAESEIEAARDTLFTNGGDFDEIFEEKINEEKKEETPEEENGTETEEF